MLLRKRHKGFSFLVGGYFCIFALLCMTVMLQWYRISLERDRVEDALTASLVGAVTTRNYHAIEEQTMALLRANLPSYFETDSSYHERYQEAIREQGLDEGYKYLFYDLVESWVAGYDEYGEAHISSDQEKLGIFYYDEISQMFGNAVYQQGQEYKRRFQEAIATGVSADIASVSEEMLEWANAVTPANDDPSLFPTMTALEMEYRSQVYSASIPVRITNSYCYGTVIELEPPGDCGMYELYDIASGEDYEYSGTRFVHSVKKDIHPGDMTSAGYSSTGYYWTYRTTDPALLPPLGNNIMTDYPEAWEFLKGAFLMLADYVPDMLGEDESAADIIEAAENGWFYWDKNDTLTYGDLDTMLAAIEANGGGTIYPVYRRVAQEVALTFQYGSTLDLLLTAEECLKDYTPAYTFLYGIYRMDYQYVGYGTNAAYTFETAFAVSVNGSDTEYMILNEDGSIQGVVSADNEVIQKYYTPDHMIKAHSSAEIEYPVTFMWWTKKIPVRVDVEYPLRYVGVFGSDFDRYGYSYLDTDFFASLTGGAESH